MHVQRLIAIVAALCAVVPEVRGQDPPPEPSDSRLTRPQEMAIARVDDLSIRLSGMPWGLGVVSALSRLGSVACRYDQELGIRVFEKGYSVATGLDLDLNEESSVYVLSDLTAESSKCQPEFGFRSPIDGEESSQIEALASLDATLASVKTSPSSAIDFARNVAENFSSLEEHQQVALVSSLLQVRQELPSEADAVFQRALLQVASSGSLGDLFALGNYIFGPRWEDSDLVIFDGAPPLDAVEVIPMAEGTVYSLSETRPGIPSDLAQLYVASSSEIVTRRAALSNGDAMAFALTSQLAAWAQSNAPLEAPVLAELLTVQRAQLADRGRLSTLQSDLEPLTEPREDFETMLDSAPDELTKASLRFNFACFRIQTGDLEGAREFVAELEDDVRQPLLDIIDLKEMIATIESGDLEAAHLGLSKLRDDLYLALAALHLASAHWNRSEKSGHESDADVRAASEAIQLARVATARVTAHVRSNVRLAIAQRLALTERFDDSLQTLELAIQEFNTAQRAGQEPDGEPSASGSVTMSSSGQFYTNVIRNEVPRHFRLLPLETPTASFGDVVGQLSVSPETDLDRLEGVVARTVNSQMQAMGLVAVAEGHLARAF